jgi:branched-chain amino acid transport system substrate-binding protein
MRFSNPSALSGPPHELSGVRTLLTVFVLLVASILFGLLLAGCRNQRPTLRIGALASLTGPVGSAGESTRRGYELAVQEWNGRGGLLGRHVHLLLEDDKGDPAEGADLAGRMVQHDRVVALLGPSLSRVAATCAPIAQAAALPMVCPTVSDPAITEAGDYIHRACFTDRTQGEAAAALAYRVLKARRAACIFDAGDSYPSGLGRSFRDAFTALGGRVVANAGHATGTANFKPQVTVLLAAKPDLVYIPDFYPDAVLIAREAKAQGYKGLLLGGDGWDTPRLGQMGGQALEGGWFTTHFSRDEERPQVKAFVAAFRGRFRAEPDAYAALAYDAANLLFDAIQRAGTADGPAVRAALAQADHPGVSGRIRFDGRRNPIKPPVILEIRDGRLVYRGRSPV